MKIQFLGTHSSESKSARCASLLIDDSLAVDAGGITAALSLKRQKRLKSILLTHAHFDHIKDIPLVALNLFRMNVSIKVLSLPEVNAAVSAHLLDGAIYPLLQELPAERPTVSFHSITPYKEQKIESYHVMAVPVNHTVNAIGYQIRDDAGKALFYTGDTGPGLSDCWEHLSFQLLIIDTTFPNDYERYARNTGHLTPNLLLAECIALRKIKKSLPRIICMHRDPLLGNKVEKEIAEVAAALDSPIMVARENMEVVL